MLPSLCCPLLPPVVAGWSPRARTQGWGTLDETPAPYPVPLPYVPHVFFLPSDFDFAFVPSAAPQQAGLNSFRLRSQLWTSVLPENAASPGASFFKIRFSSLPEVSLHLLPPPCFPSCVAGNCINVLTHSCSENKTPLGSPC